MLTRLPSFVRLLLGMVLVLAVLLLLNVWVERPVMDPMLTSFYGMNGYKETVIVFCGINIILAVALNIVNGFTGQFSLGHIGFYAVGAYVAAALATYGHARLFPGLPVDGHPIGVAQSAFPLLLLCLLGGLAAAAVGYVVGLPSLRLRGDYLAILTLGFAQIIQTVILNTPAIYGSTTFNSIPLGAGLLFVPHLADFFWVYLIAAVTIWVAYGLRFSTHGLAFLAVREDEVAAEAMGINTTRYKVIAFVLSAFFTGVAGALFALYQTSLTSGQFSFMQGINIVVMVVLGGLGSISGVALAAVLLTVLPEALRSLPDGEQYRLVVYPLLLIVLMLTRPQGIFGREELSRAWLWGQWDGLRGLRFRRPALADGPDVMQTSRDREATEVETGQE